MTSQQQLTSFLNKILDASLSDKTWLNEQDNLRKEAEELLKTPLMVPDIPKYIFEKSEVNGFDFYKYLHITGGSGNWKGKGEKYRNGGEFDVIVFYAMPEEMEDKPTGMCDRLWCIEKGIVYGEGKTIIEAYKNYSALSGVKDI